MPNRKDMLYFQYHNRERHGILIGVIHLKYVLEAGKKKNFTKAANALFDLTADFISANQEPGVRTGR